MSRLQGGQQPLTPEQQQEQQEQQQEADQQRQSMLHAIMQPAARERCESPHTSEMHSGCLTERGAGFPQLRLLLFMHSRLPRPC